MATPLACLVGLLFAAALYLMLSGVLIRFVFGLTIIGNAINLLIFAAGRLNHSHPPLIPAEATLLSQPAANALPQAMILTAIVIGFAMITFLLVLLYRTYAYTGTLDADEAPFQEEWRADDSCPPPLIRTQQDIRRLRRESEL
ncbi:NADH-quinone oxidoreductase subunit K [Desulfofustis limnaeus]|jgi:multisubunit Na+/H+ antiporter MnhC subunit|uniref:Cation:proton antiporter n=1 Tax=Desulfofustis limnaeus TaxID=2740163 RepID=A0ABN6M5W9_9BACT|nr:NADH-quinone oxidoreductase subunit K [Desulfofustis limnaeus]MDX9894810.1 NADH-quinone oxidoreductase subunit K [Desulfofustis sp.]BDD86502.1 cation:proton antiporter [Desulfofustis limnaeus]